MTFGYFLHIHSYSRPEWTPGSNFAVGDIPNNYWKGRRRPFTIPNSNKMVSGYKALQALLHKCKTDMKWAAKNLEELVNSLALATSGVGHLTFQIREVIFEHVRLKSYPQLPSRQRCIWLIDDSDEAALAYWSCRLTSKPPHQSIQTSPKLFRLKCSGQLHRANATHLDANENGVAEWLIAADVYWSGINGQNSATDEILFVGDVEVVDELPMPNT